MKEKGETGAQRKKEGREVKGESEGNHSSLRTNNDQTEVGLGERQREMSS